MPKTPELLGVEKRRGSSQKESGRQPASRSASSYTRKDMTERLYRYRVTWKDGYSMIIWAWNADDAASQGGLNRWKYNTEKVKIRTIELEDVPA